MRISPGKGDRMHRIDVIPYAPSGLAPINIMNPGLTPGATFFRAYGASFSHAIIGSGASPYGFVRRLRILVEDER